MATSPTCIIAYTGEDDRYAGVRRAAIDTARTAQARLILYDIDAAQLFASPRPTEWSGQRDEETTYGELMEPEDLERAGRHAIAEQVREARDAGVQAFGWLPDSKGGDALAEYADHQSADLILMPEAMDEAGFIDRLRGATVKDAVEKTHRPVGVVTDNGEIRYP